MKGCDSAVLTEDSVKMAAYFCLTRGALQGFSAPQLLDAQRQTTVLLWKHSLNELIEISLAQSASLWSMYGKSTMSVQQSQLLLNLNSLEPVNFGIWQNNTEPFAIALCHLAQLHADQALALTRQHNLQRLECKTVLHLAYTQTWCPLPPPPSSLHLQLLSSNMEALGGYPSKVSSSRPRLVSLVLSATLCVTSLYLLHAKMSTNRKHADFYSFQVKDTKGRSVSLEKYRGKVSLVVNVASHSEQTEGNYRELQELHRALGSTHFTVLAFPCSQYGDTELGTARDAEVFARSNHAVTFPFFNTVKIMGSEAEPAFRFLTDSVQQIPKWNFWKFLVSAEGQVVRVWKPEESIEEIRKEATALVREMILKKRHEL
ncbi:putative glutathione peroxidase 8 [Bagarius yarrelli]|uniref:Glutathione peroxidase n=1 Tax=Bagarius yarrelli TaxID=175774 RepID=A0A556VUG6_BAGYA|nr:putative glutathione peroxidase 8 [Bagarius yarrelli]